MTFLAAAGAVVALTIGILTLVGLGARFVLLPWIRSELDPVKIKVEETHHQVTVNAHASPEPTVLDKLDEVKGSLTAVAHMYEEHIRHSVHRDAELWLAIGKLQGQAGDRRG